jgi:hypothetical protein
MNSGYIAQRVHRCGNNRKFLTCIHLIVREPACAADDFDFKNYSLCSEWVEGVSDGLYCLLVTLLAYLARETTELNQCRVIILHNKQEAMSNKQ